eukprot:7127794-Alexandrium_andersonii.AAC.1
MHCWQHVIGALWLASIAWQCVLGRAFLAVHAWLCALGSACWAVGGHQFCSTWLVVRGWQ